MAYDEVSEDTVYTCVGHPLRKDIQNIVHWMLNENFTMAYNSILLLVESLIRVMYWVVAAILNWLIKPLNIKF